MAKESSYPRPKIECPRCSLTLTPSHRVRVKYRDNEKNVPEWKILERQYICKKCGLKHWHEVAAKPIEGGVL